MFTGLVEGVGEIVAVTQRGGGLRLVVECGAVGDGVSIGDSIAVSGCCLTVVAIDKTRLAFDAVPETLSRTWFKEARPGRRVNLERALRVGDRLGGHIVQGHVDGLAKLVERRPEGGAGGQVRFEFEAPEALVRDMVVKGSVALDGVSLTLIACERSRFAVAVVPHTLAVTTFSALAPGQTVHVETDVLAKWVRRLVEPYLPGGAGGGR